MKIKKKKKVQFVEISVQFTKQAGGSKTPTMGQVKNSWQIAVPPGESPDSFPVIEQKKVGVRKQSMAMQPQRTSSMSGGRGGRGDNHNARGNPYQSYNNNNNNNNNRGGPHRNSNAPPMRGDPNRSSNVGRGGGGGQRGGPNAGGPPRGGGGGPPRGGGATRGRGSPQY